MLDGSARHATHTWKQTLRHEQKPAPRQPHATTTKSIHTAPPTQDAHASITEDPQTAHHSLLHSRVVTFTGSFASLDARHSQRKVDRIARAPRAHSRHAFQCNVLSSGREDDDDPPPLCPARACVHGRSRHSRSRTSVPCALGGTYLCDGCACAGGAARSAEQDAQRNVRDPEHHKEEGGHVLRDGVSTELVSLAAPPQHQRTKREHRAHGEDAH